MPPPCFWAILPGVIGEYLGRLYEESRKRPLYIVESALGLPHPEDTYC